MWPAPEDSLVETAFIDHGHPSLRNVVRDLDIANAPPLLRARACFNWVRDHIRYDFVPKRDRARYVASRVLADGHGFCVQKAVLLCALGRAAGVPTALVVRDLRDHSMPAELRQALGTDLLRHGLNAFHLDGRWREADASLSPDITDLRGYRTVELRDDAPALLSRTTASGAPHAEYLELHGAFSDLPFDHLEALFLETYADADLDALTELGFQV